MDESNENNFTNKRFFKQRQICNKVTFLVKAKKIQKQLNEQLGMYFKK